MDLHNIAVGDIVITSFNEEAKVLAISFFPNDVRLFLSRDVTGWKDGNPDNEWYYHYDGRFVTSGDDCRDVANIVKVIKHD